MAIAMDSFSIREYVVKSRSVEGGRQRCWPFNGEPSALPEMNIKKFSWWANEAQRVKVEGGASQADQLNSTEDWKLVTYSGRTKQRAPKKRSIVELFAVAPPIDSVEDGGGIDEKENTSGVVLSQVKKDGVQDKEDWVQSVREFPEEEIGKLKPLKKRKKKRNLNTEIICTVKSGRIHKPKQVLPIDVSQLLQGSVHRKRFRKTYPIPTIRQKKNLASQGLERKQNVKNLKAIQRNKKDFEKVLPVHGILKNQTKGTLKKIGVKEGPCGSIRTKTICDSRKHVTFSGRDDILGNNDDCALMELPQLQKLCKIFTDVLAASSVKNSASRSENFRLAVEEPEAVNTSEKCISIEIAENRAGSSSQKQQTSDAPNHLSPAAFENSSILAKCSLVEPDDLNHEMQSNACLDGDRADCSNLSSCHLFCGTQAQVSPQEEVLNSEVEFLAEESCCRSKRAPDVSSVVGSHASWSDVVGSKAMTGNSLQTLMSGSIRSVEPTERLLQPSIDPKLDIYRYIPERQITYTSQISSKSTFCSSVGSIDPAKFGNQAIQSGPSLLCNSKCIDENFEGLPLNSQGEFVRNPSSKSCFSELYRKHNPNLLSVYNCPSSALEPSSSVDQLKVKEKISGKVTNRRDQLYLQPEKHQSPDKVLTYGSGYIQFHTHGRPQMQDHGLLQEQGLWIQNELVTEASFNGSEEQNRSHPCVNTMRQRVEVEGHSSDRFQPALQPTMRLMGKNVTVGKSSNDCLSFDNDKIWTDKKIITEDPISAKLLEPSRSRHWPAHGHPANGMPRGDLHHSLQTASNFLQVPTVADRVDKMSLGLGPKLVSRDRRHPLPLGIRSSLDSLNHPLPASVPCSNILTHPLNCNPMPELVKVGHQLPFRSHPQDIYQHIKIGSTHCKHSQSISFELSPESSLGSSCMNQRYLSFANPSFGNSSWSLPRWLLDAAENRLNQRPCCSSYSNPAACNQPCNFHGSNTSSMCPTSVVSFPAYGIVTSQACGLSAPVSLRRTSVSPIFPTNHSSSISGIYQAKMPNWHGKSSNFIYSKRSSSTRTRKRKTAKDARCMKPAKKFAHSMQHDLNTPMAQIGIEQSQESGQLNSGASDANVTETMTMGNPVMNVEKEDSGRVSRSASQKIDTTTKPRPFRLCSGTKHILTPGQTVDSDNSTPVHSTAPLAIENSSGNVPLSQTKATKIYTF